MKTSPLNTCIVFLLFLLSCSNYRSKQLHNAYKAKSNKIIWNYPTLAYSFIKAEGNKDIRNSLDSTFYTALKTNLSVIPQDSFYNLTNEYRDNDSATTAAKKILQILSERGVNFIAFPEYYNFFERKVKSRGGFTITIGKGINPKPIKFKVIDSTSFFLAVSLAYLDENDNLKIKTFNSQRPKSYNGRRNKYLPGEQKAFRVFELKTISDMTSEIGIKIKDYINSIDIQKSHINN